MLAAVRLCERSEASHSAAYPTDSCETFPARSAEQRNYRFRFAPAFAAYETAIPLLSLNDAFSE